MQRLAAGWDSGMSKVFHQALSTVMQNQSKFKLILIGKAKSNTNKLLLIIMGVKAFVYGRKLGNKFLQISAC